MDEQDLRFELDRAAEVENLLRNPILQDAFEALEARYSDAWRVTADGDTERREYLFKLFRALGDVQAHLKQIVETGDLAKNQLEALKGRKRTFL
jgi:ketosteroid isomerase-like protein